MIALFARGGLPPLARSKTRAGVVTRLDQAGPAGTKHPRSARHPRHDFPARRASFKSLRDSWADTRNASGRLMITILAGLAEFERELIRSRCGEGIERAKQRGVRFGRPKKLIAHQRQEALQRLEEGATQADVDFSEATISRLVARPFGGAQEEGLAA